LGIDDRQGGDERQESGDPRYGRAIAVNTAAPATRDCEHHSYLGKTGQSAEITAGERRDADQCQPTLKDEKIERRVDVVQAVKDDLTHARGSKMEADALVPPDTLIVQPIETEGKPGQQQDNHKQPTVAVQMRTHHGRPPGSLT